MLSCSLICPNPLPVPATSRCLPSGSWLIFSTSFSLSCFPLQFKICTHFCVCMSVCACMCVCYKLGSAQVTEHAVFCPFSFGSLCLNILFSSSNHLFFFLKIPIFFTGEQNSTVCTYHLFFTHSSVYVRQGSSQLLASEKRAARNADAQVPHGVQAQEQWGRSPLRIRSWGGSRHILDCSWTLLVQLALLCHVFSPFQ